MRKKVLCKECGKEKELTFQGNGIQYPVFSCPEHGTEKNEWEIWWQKYHDRYKDKEYWQRPIDRPSCVVGYFCNEFQKFYGYTYTLDYNNTSPYKSKDFVIARRLLTMFGEDFMLIPGYIKWVFAKRIKTVKKTITSFGFFATSDFVNAYKAARARNLILKRSTPLPNDFLDWCKENCPIIFEKQELSTWNDLNGLVTHIKCYGVDNPEGVVINKAIELGLLQPGQYKKLED